MNPSEQFKQFVEAVRGKDYWEVIDLATQEATRAERNCYRSKNSGNADLYSTTRYASTLKDLIFFIRYGVRPPGVERDDFLLFQSVCESLAQKRQTNSRC